MSQPASHHDVDLQPVPARIVATWPEGTFVENIAVLRNGDFVVAVHNRRQLWRVDATGAKRPWVELAASPAGLVAYGDGVLVAMGEIGTSPHRIIEVRADGTIAQRAVIDDALFLNGMTPLDDGRVIVADSLRGALYEVEPASGRVTERWRHDWLGKCSDEPMLPGANGIKLRDGRVIVTNTDRAIVIEVDLDAAPSARVIAEHLRADDLAVDADSALYLTNHIHNTLIRLDRAGERIAIAGPAEGMPGCTACTFHAAAPGALFVTTTGGIVMPFDGVLQVAKLVRLDVGASGHPVPPMTAGGA